MTTCLHLRCGGCFAETRSTPIRSVADISKAIPEGWVWSDPYTQATYCPKCWKQIEPGAIKVHGRNEKGWLGVTLPKPRVSNPNFLTEELASFNGEQK